jgi:hypothetical protein
MRRFDRPAETGAEPKPGICDVVGCDKPAADAVVHLEASHVMEFRICEVHAGRSQEGQRPMVVAERPDLGQRFSRPAVIMTVAGPQQVDHESQRSTPPPSHGPVEPSTDQRETERT